MTWSSKFVGGNGETLEGDKYWMSVCHECIHQLVCRLPQTAGVIQSLLTSQDRFTAKSEEREWANGSAELKCQAFEKRDA